MRWHHSSLSCTYAPRTIDMLRSCHLRQHTISGFLNPTALHLSLNLFLNLRLFIIWLYLAQNWIFLPTALHLLFILCSLLPLLKFSFSLDIPFPLCSLLNPARLVQCLPLSWVLSLTLWLRGKSPTLPVIAGKWLTPLHLNLPIYGMSVIMEYTWDERLNKLTQIKHCPLYQKCYLSVS